MNTTIREINPETDFIQLVPILSAAWEEPLSVQQLNEWYNRRADGWLGQRNVLVTDAGEVIGYSYVYHEPWMGDGRFGLVAIVASGHRQQGYGQQLYQQMMQWLEPHQPQQLNTEVQESCPAGLIFAQKHGFVITHHMFKSKIDLIAFDSTVYDDLLTKLQADGFRFFSLAEAGDTLEARRKLYDLNYATSLDDPGSSGTFIDFAAFNHNFNTASWFRADGQLLASVMVEGEEKYVGLSAVGYFASDNYMYNLFTGVDRAYRGHKLAQALKSLSIRYAQKAGADYIITHNDSQNAPMLAVNRKLGYQPLPGSYRMIKKL